MFEIIISSYFFLSFYLFYVFQLYFNSILFHISFRYTAQWLENHILYNMFPPIFPVAIWHHTNNTILLTIFPMLYFISTWLFCNYQFILLNPFTFFTRPLILFPSGNHLSVLCIYESVSVLLVCIYFALQISHIS